MNSILFATILVGATNFNFFNFEPLYENSLAHPRSVESELALKSSRYLGEERKYIEGAIGKEFTLITFEINEFLIQLGGEASTWVVLGHDDGAFPMLMQDYLFALPLSFRYKKFSGAIKFNHISAHLGDGMEDVAYESLSRKEKREYDQKEEIANYYDVHISLTQPINYSRDYFSGHFSYEHMIWKIRNRTYVHAGYAHKMVPDDLERWFMGYGVELIYSLIQFNNMSPYLANDMTYNQDTDSIDYSGELGVILSRGKMFETRVAFTTYIGYDRRGQLVDRKLKQIGVGIFVR